VLTCLGSGFPLTTLRSHPIQAKKAQIEQAIAALKAVMAAASGSSDGSMQGASIAPNAFLGMNIPDVVKKYLSVVRQKKSTQDLMKALGAGGMPAIAYSSIYAVLRRRQRQIGDIVNMKGDWGLAEWYPNFKFKSGKPEPTGIGASDSSDQEDEPEKTDKEDADK
jgi:hypothetical protein